jgi:hypothetical protein
MCETRPTSLASSVAAHNTSFAKQHAQPPSQARSQSHTHPSSLASSVQSGVCVCVCVSVACVCVCNTPILPRKLGHVCVCETRPTRGVKFQNTIIGHVIALLEADGHFSLIFPTCGSAKGRKLHLNT